MRSRLPVSTRAPFLVVALLLAPPGPAPAVDLPPRGPTLKDHRDLRLFMREISVDRRTLERLRVRLDRLEALLSARVLNLRAVGEFHAKVQEEMQREARAKRLGARPTLAAAARASPSRPLTPPGGGPQAGTVRFYTAADESRVDQITEAWVALRGRLARADVEERYTLLAERLSLARFELADDLRAFKALGGDLSSFTPEDQDAEEADAPARGR
jgi:hypothetical protein